MSEIDLVVAALTAGASAGVTATTNSAVQDAYAAFKKMLRPWLRGEARAALNADERDPIKVRARLGKELKLSGAAEDDEVIAAARELLATARESASTTVVVEGPVETRARDGGVAIGVVGRDATVHPSTPDR